MILSRTVSENPISPFQTRLPAALKRITRTASLTQSASAPSSLRKKKKKSVPPAPRGRSVPGKAVPVALPRAALEETNGELAGACHAQAPHTRHTRRDAGKAFTSSPLSRSGYTKPRVHARRPPTAPRPPRPRHGSQTHTPGNLWRAPSPGANNPRLYHFLRNKKHVWRPEGVGKARGKNLRGSYASSLGARPSLRPRPPGHFPSHPPRSRSCELRSGLRARQSPGSSRLPSTPPLPPQKKNTGEGKRR